MGMWHIFRREVQSYFQSFIAYVIISAFLLLAGYFFYTDLLMYIMWTMKKVDFEKIWEFYFNDIRYMMTIIMPLITMRLFAEEKKLGTIELLWTYPLRDWEVFVGKYLFALLMLVDHAGPDPDLSGGNLSYFPDRPAACFCRLSGVVSHGLRLYHLRRHDLHPDGEPNCRRPGHLPGPADVLVSDLE